MFSHLIYDFPPILGCPALNVYFSYVSKNNPLRIAGFVLFCFLIPQLSEEWLLWFLGMECSMFRGGELGYDAMAAADCN